MTSDDRQDRAIHAALAQDPPEDAGFSARVVARLPRRHGRQRALLLAAVAVIGALPAVALPSAQTALPSPGLLAAALALAALVAIAWLATESGVALRDHA